MNKLIGILFSFTCMATSAVSNSLMGAGMWFWLIIFIGLFSAVSQFVPKLKGAGSGLALCLSGISIVAIFLGTIASTIGGAFRMDESTILLMLLFFLNAILGFTLASLHKDSLKPKHNDIL